MEIEYFHVTSILSVSNMNYLMSYLPLLINHIMPQGSLIYMVQQNRLEDET